MGFYNYKGRSVGRVMHFLFDVYHIIRSDSFVFGGDGKIYESHSDCEKGKVLMEYIWFGTTDVPLFVPVDLFSHEGNFKYKELYNKQVEVFNSVINKTTMEDFYFEFIEDVPEKERLEKEERDKKLRK